MLYVKKISDKGCMVVVKKDVENRFKRDGVKEKASRED